ncbi:MAG TPA: hypothetical protein VHT05_07115 [Candidatus Elarobacter sp.]|jgi:hypothetical protein|nr:hypothetical protein [Candidatus Elarobacter sp.]
MNAARALATAAVAFACALPVAVRSDDASPAGAPPTGAQILAHVKAVFRAHVRPPYVAYTVERRDSRDGTPDLENSYALKVWCRTSDRSALTRHAWRGSGYGSIANVTVAFDGYVDPGPPTADIFERALFAPHTARTVSHAGASPAPEPESPLPESSETPLPVIGAIVVAHDYDYRVTGVEQDGTNWHLHLEPRRDPARNRIDDLWVDRATYEVTRMRVRDHLYLGFTGQSVDDEFDVRFTQHDGLPLIASIHGLTSDGIFETEYTFSDVTFPPSLPPWYFTPQLYGLHRTDAPS